LAESEPARKDHSKNLRKVYSRLYPKTDLHHPIPKSRIPLGSSQKEIDRLHRENNWQVFPYDKHAHNAYHFLFLNLRIDQVWDRLTQIHRTVFESPGEHTARWWLECCDLESRIGRKRNEFNERKADLVRKEYRIIELQSAWKRAFGGSDLRTAENLLRITMLFMVFGSRMTSVDKLLNNKNLIRFIENEKPNGHRLWAFEILFGNNGRSIKGIKSQIVSILNKNRFYYK